MGIKISEMTPDASIGGGELIPVSDSGTAKSVTTAGLKSYVVDQIEAITAGTAVTGADSVFVLQGGVLKPVDIDLVAQHAIDTVWGKADDASPAGTDKIAIKDAGTTENTVTLANLATYVQTATRAAVLNPATLDAAGTTSGDDLFVIGQSGVAKKITLTAINTAIYAGLAAYLTAATAATAATDADVFYILQGGLEYQVTLAQIKTQLGITNMVTIPGSMTENYVPQWSATTKVLKEGLPVAATVAASGATTGGLPTDTAVRAAIETSNIGGTVTEKAAPVAADRMFIRDSEAAEAYKAVLLSNMSAFVVDQIEAIAAGAVVSADDSIYILQDGALKPVDIANLATYLEGYFTGLELGELETTAYRGDRGKTAYDHSQAAHAPSDAQKNSDITKTEIEAKLTGEISSHTHAGGGGGAMAFASIITETTTYRAVSSGDVGSYIVFDNANAINYYIGELLNSEVSPGDIIEIEQRGAGAVTITDGGGSSSTVHASASEGLKTNGQYSTIRVVCVDTSSYPLIFVAKGGIAV